jgi:hypothetical protein
MFTVHCPLLAVYYPLSIVHCSLFICYGVFTLRAYKNTLTAIDKNLSVYLYYQYELAG